MILIWTVPVIMVYVVTMRLDRRIRVPKGPYPEVPMAELPLRE